MKNLNLEDSGIETQIINAGNEYTIILSTDKLAKNVYLSIPGRTVFFEDNYFDLLPGIKKEVKFKTD